MCLQNGRVRGHGCYTPLFAKAKRSVLRSLHLIGAGDADGSCDRDRVNSRLTSVGDRGRRQPSTAIGVRYNMEAPRRRNTQQHQPKDGKSYSDDPDAGRSSTTAVFARAEQQAKTDIEVACGEGGRRLLYRS